MNPQPRVDRWAIPLGPGDRRGLLLAGDLILVGAITLMALRLGALRSDWAWSVGFVVEHAYWFLICAGLWVGLAWANGLYDLRQAPDRWEAAVLSVKVSAQILVIWAVAYFVPPPWTLVRHVVVFFSGISAAVMPLWRQMAAALLSRPGFRRRVLIFGTGPVARAAVNVIESEAPHDFDIVGFVSVVGGADVSGGEAPGADALGAVAPGTDVPGVESVVGGVADLVRRSQELRATEIVLAVTRDLPADAVAALMDAREQGLLVSPYPLFYERLTGRVPVEHVGDQWAVALPLDPPRSRGLYPLFRRGADVAVALVGLAGLGLLLPLLAVLNRLSGPGRLFYRQLRVGRGGRNFELLKLRTMIPDAEPDGPRWAALDDNRVTPIGRWLRRTRLDELPQTLNVLRGDMSLVGPRPERPEFVDRLAEQIPFYRARHAVRPGITGWASVHQDYAASEADALEKLQYDLYYIKHQSMLLDAAILLRTAAKVVTLSGR